MLKLDSLLNFLGWMMLFFLIGLATLFVTVAIAGFVEGFTIAWNDMKAEG